MNFLLEVLAYIIVALFLVASCSDKGLQVNVDGQVRSVKIGGSEQ